MADELKYRWVNWAYREFMEYGDEMLMSPSGRVVAVITDHENSHFKEGLDGVTTELNKLYALVIDAGVTDPANRVNPDGWRCWTTACCGAVWHEDSPAYGKQICTQCAELQNLKDTIADTKRRIDGAVAAEREACLDIAIRIATEAKDRHDPGMKECWNAACVSISDVIRVRTTPPADDQGGG